ncbi:MAG: DMP19 family protein, partial [Planctomycetia bacterium]|nr:DMP19 family protein [Planctomycetia bacterium]
SQRVVWNVAELISEVENGGFHQFLYNSSGDNAAETATQLRLIGAPKTAAMVDTACGLFPRTGPAKELELRRTQLARLSDKQIAVLDDLDAQFYARDEDLCLLLKAYWQKSSPNGPPPAANAPLDLNKPNWPNGAANESLLKRYAGTAIMLTLAAIVAVAIWRSSRPKWSLVAVIDREGVKLHQGIAQAHQRYVIDFLRNEVPVETPVTIRALREPDGQLRTEFAGGIDAGTRQRIRNFLLTMM